MKRIAVLTAMLGVLLLVIGLSDRAVFHAPPTAEAAETTTDFFYGENPDGTIGPVGPGQAAEKLVGLSVPPFCTGCYITRIQPDLVYFNDPNPLLTNGMSANYNADNGQGIWLHHDGLVDSCFRTIFLSGNERTVYQSLAGYGSYIGVPGSPDDPSFCNGSWFITWHIHNAGNVNHKVKLKFTVTYRTGETLTRVKGVGLNVATATNAEYTIPTGYSDTHTCPSNCGTGINTDHIVTAAEQGQIIAGGGHVHDYGFGVSAFNVTRNQWICTSIGGYGATSRYLPTGGPGTPGHPAAANAQTLNHAYHLPSTPDNAYHIQNMSLCGLSPSGSILCTGDVIRVHASYNNTSGFPITDAMGIMSLALPATPPDADGDGTWDGCDTSDFDADGYKDRVEAPAGTAVNDPCADTATPNDEADDKWPADLNDDRFSDGTDITILAGWFGKAVPQVPARGDIADPVDGFVDGTDITSIAGHFGDPCGP